MCPVATAALTIVSLSILIYMLMSVLFRVCIMFVYVNLSVLCLRVLIYEWWVHVLMYVQVLRSRQINVPEARKYACACIFDTNVYVYLLLNAQYLFFLFVSSAARPSSKRPSPRNNNSGSSGGGGNNLNNSYGTPHLRALSFNTRKRSKIPICISCIMLHLWNLSTNNRAQTLTHKNHFHKP